MDWHLLFYRKHIVIVFGQQARLTVYFAQAHQAIKSLLKCIVVADDEELVEAAHTPDLLCQIRAAQEIHVLRRLIEEGDIERGELFEQRQANGQRRAHLLAAAQLREGAIDSLAAQDDLVIVLPEKLRAAVAHDLAEDPIGLG